MYKSLIIEKETEECVGYFTFFCIDDYTAERVSSEMWPSYDDEAFYNVLEVYNV